MKKSFNRKSVSITAELYEALNEHCERAGIAMAGLVEATMREKLGLTPTKPKRRYEIAARQPLREVNGKCLVAGQVSSFDVSSDGAVERVMVRPI